MLGEEAPAGTASFLSEARIERCFGKDQETLRIVAAFEQFRGDRRMAVSEQ
jgi:hypothetical protein